MSLAWWALLVSCLSLLIAGGSLGWQVFSWRRARSTQLEVHLGRLPDLGADEIWLGIEVVNHSDFAVRVQDVQLVFAPEGERLAEPLIVGLRADKPGTIPGTVAPHDSGFIATGVPSFAADESGGRLCVYANAITAVGNVRSRAFEVNEVPTFPAPMRFNRLFPERSASAS